ncbi:MAG: pitrilysin family protein [Patescibacteria group bacterium]
MKKDFSRIQLANGLRVILAPRAGDVSVTALVLVQAGSEYETKEMNGISHFLEHMCFKGTERRPTALLIASELDGLGAEYNAFTSQELTAYYVKVKSEFFPQAFDVVSDIYSHSRFGEAEIEREKGVIQEEINMYEDMPQRKVQELFMECVYGDQPAGWTIAGRKEVIRRLRREDFLRYRGAHYVPQSTVVVVSGGFQEKEAVLSIEKQFASLAPGPKDGKRKVRDTQKLPRELQLYKKSDQTHLVLGVRAFPFFDERRFALQVLTDILGGGMSSRLFHRIREELGAAYYVRANDDLYTDHGLLTVSAGVDHAKLNKVIEASLQEFRRLKTELVTPAEIQKAKNHIIGTFFLSLDTSDGLGYFYAMQEIHGMPLRAPEQIARKIRAVTAEDVQVLARQLFRPNRLNFALIGPFRKRSFKNFFRVL